MAQPFCGTTPEQICALLLKVLPEAVKGILVTAPDGTLLHAAGEITGGMGGFPEIIPGSPITRYLPPRAANALSDPNEGMVRVPLPGQVFTVFFRRAAHLPYSLYFWTDLPYSQAATAEMRSLEERIEDLRSVIDASYDGVYVTRWDGYTLLVNRSHERISGIPSSHLVGRYMKDLVDEGVFGVTLTEQVVKEKKPVTITQATSSGKSYLITGTPLLGQHNEVRKVITNVRDISELSDLEKELRRAQAVKKHYQDKLLYAEGGDIIAESPAFLNTMILASKIARRNSTVLIQGETGVGKEVIAKYIHLVSERKDKDFLKINCGAIPEHLLESELFGYVKGAFTGASQSGKMGIFELANGGTLFLDELGELPLNLQSSLLRVLQDGEIIRVGDTKYRKVDVRIIAATNRNLEEMVQQNAFRRDLYYRLNVLTIFIPPLRQRVEDIPPLAEAYLKKLNEKYQTRKFLTRSFLQYLCQRKWPGNVRELQNFIERQYVICDDEVLDAACICEPGEYHINDSNIHIALTGIPKMKDAVCQLKRLLMREALERAGNTYRAAELLGISQSTFSRQYSELIKASPADTPE